MNFQEFNIYTTRPAPGGCTVTDKSFMVGKAVVDPEAGKGIVDTFIPGMAERVNSLFERPIEIRDANGQLTRTLKPWSKEAMEYFMQQGLADQGLAAVPQSANRNI